jgi:chemotaxis signal transduction protein
MRIVNIDNNLKYSVKNNLKNEKKLEKLFIFSCSNIKFAIKISNVGMIYNNFSEIFYTNLQNKFIRGFSFNNNELVNIIDINSLLNIPTSNNIKKLLEIYSENIKVGIQIDADNFYIEELEIPSTEAVNISYKCIYKIIKQDNEMIYLLDEMTLFSIIKNNILLTK